MADNLIEIIVQLKNLRQFVSGADSAAKAVKGIGDETKETGKKTGLSLDRLAKWSAVGGAVYGAQRYIRGAVSDVENLTRGTMALQRQTTLDTETASQWVGVLKSRNIATTSFQRGLVTLSRRMEAARGGNKTAIKSFTDLGISLDQVRNSDPSAMLGHVADALQKSEDPAQRAAAAQGMLSRAGLQLLPLLMGGSAGIQEQLDMQRRYGNYLRGNSAKDTGDFLRQQREMNVAMSGLKVTLGQALMPVLVALGGVLVQVTRIIQPLLRNGTALKIVIGVLAAVFVAYKVAVAIATVANALFGTSMIAVTLPIFLVVAALIALGVVFVVLYKRVGWFRNAVNASFAAIKRAAQAVWSWIKSNWPLLLAVLAGPFGLAVALIIKHFDKVKGAVRTAVSTVKRLLNELLDFVTDIPSRIGGGLGDIASSAVNAIPGVGAARGALGVFGIGRQGGGPVLPGRRYLVGERGPEVLSVPARGQVTPLRPTGAAVGAGGTAQIHTHVYLDRKQIAEAVGTYTADQLARR